MIAPFGFEPLNFSQQIKIFNPLCSKPVTVLGAGAVGSQLILMLAKLGFPKITVYDGDAVESHNIPMSAYGVSDLGMFKVIALKELAREQSEAEIDAVSRMYAGEPLRDSVISCVDTMEARMAAWREVKNNPLVDIYIDTRTASELISIFAVNPCDAEEIAYYEHFLYPSEQALMLTCGDHGIIHASGMAACAACANLTNWRQNGKKKLHFKQLVQALEAC